MCHSTNLPVNAKQKLYLSVIDVDVQYLWKVKSLPLCASEALNFSASVQKSQCVALLFQFLFQHFDYIAQSVFYY